jgi:hypothetical protein
MMQAKYRGAASESCVTFLKRWMDLLVAEDLIELGGIEDPFLRTYGRSIEFMAFHRRACVIKKRVTPTDWRVSAGPPLSPRPADALTTVVSAHFGMRGDIFGPEGYVDEGADTFTIQGFALESETGVIEYRVRFPDGAWSEWVGEGVFAGTRGQAIPITGFAARIADRAKDRFELTSHGRFVGGFKVDKLAGEDCVAPAGAQLRGLQVIINPAKIQVEVQAAEPAVAAPALEIPPASGADGIPSALAETPVTSEPAPLPT